LRIAFQKIPQWEDKPHAEAELALRMLAAAQSIESVDAIATSDMAEIDLFEPDIVFPLHVLLPKLFDAFTVGCMWDPVSRIKRNSTWDNIKSYDGYAVSTEKQEQFVKALKFKSPQPYLLSTIYPSTNTTTFIKPKTFTSPVYIGSDWSRNRHRDLFKLANDISVYGPKNSWDYLSESIYCGEIPIDGRSSQKIYQQAGIGLSLHHENHNLEGIPSMRPFEIAASSAIIISDQNAFVQQVFGDNALYLDTSLESKAIVEQLDDLSHWIKSNPTKAQEMAEACHKIFVKKYSLEVLLKDLLQDIHKFTGDNSAHTKEGSAEVDIIVRTDGKDKEKLFRALMSINRQSYKMTTALITYWGPSDSLTTLQRDIKEEIPDLRVKYICANKETSRASQFYAGIRGSTASFIGFLDHDDVFFSNHVETLIDCLTKYPDCSLAYSGSIRIWEEGNPPEGEQVRRLAYFYELERNSDLGSCITSNSFIVRRNKIPWHLINQPVPKMQSREDYVFLSMMYNNNSDLLFSGKVTCVFYWRATREDNSAFEAKPQLTRKKVFGTVLRLSNTRIDYGENTVNNSPDNSRLVTLNFIRKITSILRKDAAIIRARLKDNSKS
jgi:hypothetical protein